MRKEKVHIKYDTTSIYSNAMAAFDIDYLNTAAINNNNNNDPTSANHNNKKKPPSYDEVIKVSSNLNLNLKILI